MAHGNQSTIIIFIIIINIVIIPFNWGVAGAVAVTSFAHKSRLNFTETIHTFLVVNTFQRITRLLSSNDLIDERQLIRIDRSNDETNFTQFRIASSTHTHKHNQLIGHPNNNFKDVRQDQFVILS